MSLFYKLAYLFGVTPWEDAAVQEAAFFNALYEREQPVGQALDLGCGTGLQSIELAKRGWETTGIDNVGKALRKAADRARDAGLAIRFVEGDVTALRAAGVGKGFTFFLDIGCFHGLTDDEREAMGREVDAVAAPGATLVLLSWKPGNRGPLPRGASQEDIEAAFVGWEVCDVDVPNVAAMPKPLKNAAPRCYRLRKAIR